MTLTPTQRSYIRFGIDRWFEPTGRGWRTCDGLVKRGLLEHNGAAQHSGERYRTTDEGKRLLL